MRSIRTAALVAAIGFGVAIPAWSGSYFGSSAPSFSSFIVVHAPGYDGTGGTYTVRVCAPPSASTVEPALRQALDIWNDLTPATSNCQGSVLYEEIDPTEPPSAPYQLLTVLAHELGHCAMGLDHIDWFDENALSGTSFTATKDAGLFDDGADNVRGSRDDRPAPLPGARVLHWFRTADNDPFVVDSTVIDTMTYSRRLIDFPTDTSWPANGNRAVGELLGYQDTHSIMYSALDAGVTFSGVIADDVNTVLYARTGLEAMAGTADDYTVALEFSSDCSSADVEIEWTDVVGGDALGECIAFIGSIDPNPTDVHFALVPSGGNERIVLKINSTVRWDAIFANGFESGTTAQWGVEP